MLTEFVNPVVEEEIYIPIPKVLKLRRTSRQQLQLFVCFNELWSQASSETQGRRSKCNSACNSTRWNCDPSSYCVIIALDVDDLIPTSNSSDLLSKVKAGLKENYVMTDLGELSWCLGIQVAQWQDSVWLTQRTWILKMIEEIRHARLRTLQRLLQVFIQVSPWDTSWYK